MAEVLLGIPVVLAVSLVWALIPLAGRPARMSALATLLVACVAFVVWRAAADSGRGAAAVIAPAALIAIFRLLFDGFSILAATLAARGSDHASGQVP